MSRAKPERFDWFTQPVNDSPDSAEAIGFLSLRVEDDGKRVLERVSAIPADAMGILCTGLSIPLILSDNHIGACAACGCAVQFRPDIPDGVPKVCLRCAPGWVEGLERRH